MSAQKRIKAWHFCNGWKLRDGTKLEVGKTYTVDTRLIVCVNGLHASRKMLDAVTYAPGNVLCKVELWGDTIEQSDKLCSSHRLVICAADVTDMLHEFACVIGEHTLACYGNDDPRSWAAIEAKRAWIAGQITNKQLDDACDVAHTAACAPAYTAAYAAARSAAMAATSAADAAAWAATWAADAAATSAAHAAAAWAADAAARDEINTALESYIIDECGFDKH